MESKVNNGVPEKVAANEEYLYKPFSVGENGARAKVHTKLTLTGKTAGQGSRKYSLNVIGRFYPESEKLAHIGQLSSL